MDCPAGQRDEVITFALAFKYDFHALECGKAKHLAPHAEAQSRAQIGRAAVPEF